MCRQEYAVGGMGGMEREGCKYRLVTQSFGNLIMIAHGTVSDENDRFSSGCGNLIEKCGGW